MWNILWIVNFILLRYTLLVKALVILLFFDQNLICLLMKKMLVQNLVLRILYWKSVAAFAFACIIKVLNFNMIFKEILWESITLRLTKNCILKKELLHNKTAGTQSMNCYMQTSWFTFLVTQSGTHPLHLCQCINI